MSDFPGAWSQVDLLCSIFPPFSCQCTSVLLYQCRGRKTCKDYNLCIQVIFSVNDPNINMFCDFVSVVNNISSCKQELHCGKCIILLQVSVNFLMLHYPSRNSLYLKIWHFMQLVMKWWKVDINPAGQHFKCKCISFVRGWMIWFSGPFWQTDLFSLETVWLMGILYRYSALLPPPGSQCVMQLKALNPQFLWSQLWGVNG